MIISKVNDNVSFIIVQYKNTKFIVKYFKLFYIIFAAAWVLNCIENYKYLVWSDQKLIFASKSQFLKVLPRRVGAGHCKLH